jgi:hypothetical protein
MTNRLVSKHSPVGKLLEFMQCPSRPPIVTNVPRRPSWWAETMQVLKRGKFDHEALQVWLKRRRSGDTTMVLHDRSDGSRWIFVKGDWMNRSAIDIVDDLAYTVEDDVRQYYNNLPKREIDKFLRIAQNIPKDINDRPDEVYFAVASQFDDGMAALLKSNGFRSVVPAHPSWVYV